MDSKELNEVIQEKFGILLVTCPICGCINSKKDEVVIWYDCDGCASENRFDESPDLFYDN